MKRILLISAIINFAVALIHTFIGESDIVAPLMASDAPDLVKATLHSAWHMISVVLYVSSFALFYLSAKGENKQLNQILPMYIGLQYIALAMVFVVTSVVYAQFFPQIVMLLPIGLLSFWAGRKANKS